MERILIRYRWENGMIYIMGDTHGDFARFSAKRLRRVGMELTQEDYIIICGDFGLCWAKDKTFEYHCKNFAEKPYTILWVQGNHENYDMIGEYPLEEWHGGKVRHIIRDGAVLRSGSADRLSGDFETEGKCSCGAGTGTDGRRNGSWQGMSGITIFSNMR